jgi:hypothetical protein
MWRMRDCFTYQNSEDGLPSRRGRRLTRALSVGLKMNMMYSNGILQIQACGRTSCSPRKCNQYDKHFCKPSRSIFRHSDSGCLCHLHVRFAQRYLKYLVPCATDFDMSKAMVIFGHKAEFYKDVCRAYGFYDVIVRDTCIPTKRFCVLWPKENRSDQKEVPGHDRTDRVAQWRKYASSLKTDRNSQNPSRPL